MAKLTLLIPMHHPNPPTEELAAMWVKIFRTNDTNQFIDEVKHYLTQAVPIRLQIKDLTSGEADYLRVRMKKMHEEVNSHLLQNGLPLLNINFEGQIEKAVVQGRDGS